MKYDINGETKYVPLDVFLNMLKIAIANKNTVESGKKKGKASQGTWDDYPPIIKVSKMKTTVLLSLVDIYLN